MPLPVKFADVSISLKQFQAISSGRHNAGEVRLKDAHTIDKVNHYVSRTGRNKVSLSHAEVIAVKQAFVDALARGGVQADEIAKVRAQLGLEPEKAVDTQLMERSLRPLSRQQIREILDRNAEALNAGQNEVTICTSAQIYARVDDDTRRRRIAGRDTAGSEKRSADNTIAAVNAAYPGAAGPGCAAAPGSALKSFSKSTRMFPQSPVAGRYTAMKPRRGTPPWLRVERNARFSRRARSRPGW